LVSYLFVIYFYNMRSYGACMLTVFSNRIGEVALLMVITWIIHFGSSLLSKFTSELLLVAYLGTKIEMMLQTPVIFPLSQICLSQSNL